MIYRETGQFKTTYASDQQLFPILQDRVFVIGFLVFAFGVMPFIGSEYLFRAILVYREGPQHRWYRERCRSLDLL